MYKYKYINWPKLVKDYPGHFETLLLYDPQPTASTPVRIDAILKNAQSTDMIGMKLPFGCTLTTAAQLQVLLTEYYGSLHVETWIDRGRRKIQVQTGSSYLTQIQPWEIETACYWSNQVFHDLINPNKSPIPNISLCK